MRIEYANGSGDTLDASLAHWRDARDAARRLGVGIVECGPDGEWRSAAPWRGSREQTERRPARGLPAPTGLNADRARRLRLAEAAIEPLALDRRAMHPFYVTNFFGFGPPR
jgi:hypothetical protein